MESQIEGIRQHCHSQILKIIKIQETFFYESSIKFSTTFAYMHVS